MNLLGALLGTSPPYTSIQVQRLDGGFLCCVPPGPPVAAEDGNCAAATLFLWLGAYTEPQGKSSPAAGVEDQGTIEFRWPEATCPEGSTFQASKLRRAGPDGKILPRMAYFLNYHSSAPGTGYNPIVFGRGGVMDHFKKWLHYTEPTADEKVNQNVSGVLRINGVRINAKLEASEEGTFHLHVTTAAPNGPAVFIARKIDLPTFEIGLADTAVVHYVAHCLAGESQGVFLARVHEAYLEFGPLIDGGEDDGDQPVEPIGVDPSQSGSA